MSLVPFKSDLLPSRSRLFDRDFLSLRDDMDNLMNNFFSPSTSIFPRISSMDFYPAIDIQEKDDKYLLEVEVPGMKEDEITLDLHDNTLTIKGERKSELKEENQGYYHTERSFGSFRRDIPFYEAINSEKVKADLKNGVLKVELLKKESSNKAHKKIKIQH